MAYSVRQRRIYMADWRQRNLALVREKRRAWYRKNQKKVRAYMKAWRKAHAESHRLHTRRWRRKKARLGVGKLGKNGTPGHPTKGHPPFVYTRAPRGTKTKS